MQPKIVKIKAEKIMEMILRFMCDDSTVMGESLGDGTFY